MEKVKPQPGAHHEKEYEGHKTSQVGIVVGCNKCDYISYTLVNTDLEHLIGEGEELEVYRSDAFRERMKNLTPEEKAHQNRPIVSRIQNAKKNATKRSKSLYAREFLNMIVAVFPCNIRKEYSQPCGEQFTKKTDLRKHMIDEHTLDEFERTYIILR